VHLVAATPSTTALHFLLFFLLLMTYTPGFPATGFRIHLNRAAPLLVNLGSVRQVFLLTKAAPELHFATKLIKTLPFFFSTSTFQMAEARSGVRSALEHLPLRYFVLHLVLASDTIL
jgi:hypothetical protein